MQGYNTLKEFIEDYKLYLAAKRIDPGRERGETIPRYLLSRIKFRITNSSKNFQAMLEKNKYSYVDLKLIATNEIIGEITSLDDFIYVCFGRGQKISSYKKLLKTNAFKNGQLNKLYEFIPYEITTKEEFINFLGSNHGLSYASIKALMKFICKGNWQEWFSEMRKDNKIIFRGGRLRHVL